MKIKASRADIWRWRLLVQAELLLLKLKLRRRDLSRRLIRLRATLIKSALFLLKLPDKPLSERFRLF